MSGGTADLSGMGMDVDFGSMEFEPTSVGSLPPMQYQQM